MRLPLLLLFLLSHSINAWLLPRPKVETTTRLWSTAESTTEVKYDAPEDAVVIIKPKAMERLLQLKEMEKKETLILRMGVKSGGCSGMSYAMDFSTSDEIQDDDQVDEYPGVTCVVDAKSMLYLYGLELDYSDELIGGGFKFFNP